MATLAQPATREADFYRNMAIGLSAFILFGFAQFAARGFVDYRNVPLIVHVHGMVMVGWLGLLVTQASLVARDNMALHRKLGWFAALLATLIAPLAIGVCVTAIRVGMAPPFFTSPYFLALVSIEGLLFSATVWWAIARRKQTDWHRRLMIGANVMLMEPALGRILPMPLIGGEAGEFVALGVQLVVIGLLLRHDRATLGRVHPATVAATLLVIAGHAAVTIGARTPFYVDLAARLAA
ncbi:MAG: hypothetical protein KGM18_05810 [Sphingomonadales bacterium]|nr:hypothetical protein [Sphingomonadales bacterium]